MWHLKKEVRNEVRDLTALAVSNIALTLYYTSNDLPPLPHFFSQYGIHTKPCFHRINCLCNISSLLLFQVTVGPCKLACFFCCKYLLISSNLFSRRFFKFTRTSFLIRHAFFVDIKRSLKSLNTSYIFASSAIFYGNQLLKYMMLWCLSNLLRLEKQVGICQMMWEAHWVKVLHWNERLMIQTLMGFQLGLETQLFSEAPCDV